MKSYRSRRFNKLLAQLPEQAQEQARKAYQLFKRDPYHPSLHFKRIDPQSPLYSVRVGAHYRAVGELEDNTIIWTWIGTHEEYNKL
jgi:mRNA-degrading endonuclease RelE of RelBE toxin-antitoxin system